MLRCVFSAIDVLVSLCTCVTPRPPARVDAPRKNLIGSAHVAHPRQPPDPPRPRRPRPPSPASTPPPVRPGVVHLGLGGFHRAHMARYTHNLMDRDPGALEWGIAGAGLLPADRRMQESLAPQDNLYTLVERDAAGETVTIIGALAAVIFAGDRRRRPPARHRGPGRPHHQPDRHRARLLPRPRHQAPRPRAPPDPPRPRRSPRARQRHGRPRRSAAPPPRCRRRAAHAAVLRQHPAQRRRAEIRRPGAGRAARSRPGPLDRRRSQLPQHHGRPHHPRDRGRRRRLAARRPRHRRPLARFSPKPSPNG